MMDDAADLVAAARSGDPHALSELVEQYQVAALRVAQNILGNRADGEDAVQNAWILAVQSLDTLRDSSKFGHWYYRIVANVALRMRQQRRAAIVDPTLLESITAESEYGEPGDAERLPVAMDALSDKEHLPMVLFYFNGVSQQSIASLLGIPLGTVKSRLHHGRLVLRREILEMTKKDVTHNAHVPEDFRKTITGMRGEIPWQSIFSGDLSSWNAEAPIAPGSVPQHWEIVGDTGLLGEIGTGGTWLMYGEKEWRNIEISLIATPLAGGNVQVFFRVDDEANRFYALDLLMGWQAAAISRVDQDANGNSTVTKLSVVNYPLEYERDYAVHIAARDHSVTSYIDGALVNQVTDDSWLHGKIGLNVWESKTLYRDIKIRLLH